MTRFLAEPSEPLEGEHSVLETIASELPFANAFGEVGSLVSLLDRYGPSDTPHSRADAGRAFAILSFLAHSHIWSIPGGRDVIPACIAVPWCNLGNQLGLPPVLSYASYVLDNRRWSPLQSGTVPLLSFTGSSDEAWFIRVHQQIELAGDPVVELVARGDDFTRSEETREDAIRRIADCLESMCQSADEMQEGCDPYIYFERVRRFFYGWKWNPAFHNRRMTYRGVDAAQLPFEGHYSGESGSQSPLLPLIDALLGVEHDGVFREYSNEMRSYMYPAHQGLVLSAKERSLSWRIGQSATFRNDYVRALEALRQFRSIHLGFAKTYVVEQSVRAKATSTSGQSVGTGGSEVLKVLGAARHAVEKTLARC